MKITSVSWFVLLIMVTIAVAASGGAVILDALSTLLIGYSLVRIRTGLDYASSADSTRGIASTAQTIWRSWRNVKMGGIATVLVTSVALSSFSWSGTAKLVVSVVAIEMLALVLLECSLRFRHLGNMAIVVLFVFFFWSVRAPSNAIAEFFLNEPLPSPGRSWTIVFESWAYLFTILVGAMIILVTLLRLSPERPDSLVARPWLFR